MEHRGALASKAVVKTGREKIGFKLIHHYPLVNQSTTYMPVISSLLILDRNFVHLSAEVCSPVPSTWNFLLDTIKYTAILLTAF